MRITFFLISWLDDCPVLGQGQHVLIKPKWTRCTSQDRYKLDPAAGPGKKSCLTGTHQIVMEIGKGREPRQVVDTKEE